MRSAYMLWAFLPLVAAGCDSLNGNAGSAPTIDLLKAGSSKACIAEDVEQTVRGLIRPKPGDFAYSTLADTDKTRIIESFQIKFDLTTLDSVDRAVSRVTCNTQVKIMAPDGKQSDGYAFDFIVRPSAETDGSFVISAQTGPAKAYLYSAVLAQMAKEALATNERQAVANHEADRLAVLQVVNEAWLIGRWVSQNGAEDCAEEGVHAEYGRGNVYQGYEDAGTWRLDGDRLEVDSTDGDGSTKTVTTIVSADAGSFTERQNDGTIYTNKRCTAEEMKAGDPDPGAGSTTNME